MGMCIIGKEPLVALPAKIYPFIISSPIRTRARASVNLNVTVIDLLPGEKDIWCPMWFMAIRARQYIAAAQRVLIRWKEIRTSIVTGSSVSVFFNIPVESIEVPYQHIAIDDVRVIVTVSTKSNIIG